MIASPMRALPSLPMSNYLMLASELYSLPILRPLARIARSAGHAVAWLCTDAMAARLAQDETRIASHRVLLAFAADATFATVHRIPPQLPGRQVQLFHGLNTDKRDDRRGHFRVRGLFDLYCTHGPATSDRFRALAREHGDFAVAETGWPKLDPLFAAAEPPAVAMVRNAARGRPIAMYASTFTESLSSAAAFLPELRRLVTRGDRYWLLTLHPKCPPQLQAEYRALAGNGARFFEATELTDALRAADVLVCDTSSVTEEFALLSRPVVTVRTRIPRDYMIDVEAPSEVDAAIDVALSRPDAQMRAMGELARQLHPWRDGQSSRRVVDAVERLLTGGFEPMRARPRLYWRRLRARADLRALLPQP